MASTEMAQRVNNVKGNPTEAGLDGHVPVSIPAPLPNRFFAALLDVFLGFLFAYSPMGAVLLLHLAGRLDGISEDRQRLVASLLPLVALGLGFIYLSLYNALFGGQSIGKKIFGICVLRQKTAEPIGLMFSAIRFVNFCWASLVLTMPLWILIGTDLIDEKVGPLIFLLPIVVEGIFVLVRDDGKRLSDMITGTQVVQKCG